MRSIDKLFIYIGLVIIILSLIFFIIFNINKKVNKNRKNTNYYSYINNKAQSEYQAKNYLKAIGFFNRLIEIDSSKGDIYYKRAYCYSQINFLELGIIDYNKSIKLNNKISDSYFNIGLNYMCLLNDSLAYFNFNLANKYNPEDIEIKSYKDFFEKRIKLKK